MVCQKCEKKLAKLSNPDVWKQGARNVIGGNDGGVKINENKLLSKKKAITKYDPYGTKCKNCKSSYFMILNQLFIYQTCAYKKGVCSMCGVKILNTKYYRQTI